MPGSGLPHVVTSSQHLGCGELPEKLTVIGKELLEWMLLPVLFGWGVRTDVVEMLPVVAGNLDRDIRKRLAESLADLG